MQIVFGFNTAFNGGKGSMKSDESLLLPVLKFPYHGNRENCCIFCLREMIHCDVSPVKSMGPEVRLPVVERYLLNS